MGGKICVCRDSLFSYPRVYCSKFAVISVVAVLWYPIELAFSDCSDNE